MIWMLPMHDLKEGRIFCLLWVRWWNPGKQKSLTSWDKKLIRYCHNLWCIFVIFCLISYGGIRGLKREFFLLILIYLFYNCSWVYYLFYDVFCIKLSLVINVVILIIQKRKKERKYKKEGILKCLIVYYVYVGDRLSTDILMKV